MQENGSRVLLETSIRPMEKFDVYQVAAGLAHTDSLLVET